MSGTYTKLFSTITESTIWCEDSDVRIVWITMLAMTDRNGRVWSSIPGLANRAQVTLEKCEEALVKFMEPDKYSRTKDNDGRRIEEIDGGWALLNHAKYREIRESEDRKAYKREWAEKKRAQEKSLVDNSGQSGPPSTYTDTDTDTVKLKRGKFKPPTIDEIAEHCKSRGNSLDAEKFFAFYESKGWMVGKNKMKSWKAAVITWEKRGNDDKRQTSKKAEVGHRLDQLDDQVRRELQQDIKTGEATILPAEGGLPEKVG